MRYGVVLTAGEGARMWPYAELRPKACLPIGSESVVGRLARQLDGAGVERLVVVSDEESHLRETLFDAALETRFVAPEAKGSAAAAAAGLAEIERWADDGADGGEALSALVVPGDLVLDDAELPALAKAFEEGGAGADAPSIIAAVGPLGSDGVPFERAKDWICALVDDDRVQTVVGHGFDFVTHRLLGALAVDARAVLPRLRATPPVMTALSVGGMPPDEAELGQTLQSMIDAGETVGARETSGVAIDLDKPWHLLGANRLAAFELCRSITEHDIDPTATLDDGHSDIRGNLRIGPRSTVGPNVIVRGNAWIGTDVVIRDGALLEGDVVIGDGTHIEGHAVVHSTSVIGAGCMVHHGAEVDGLVMDGAYLVHFCELSGIVGRKVDIGAGTISGTLRFDDEGQPINVRGRWEHPGTIASASFLGDFSRTGVGAILQPGVRVGCRSCVGPGVVLSEDLESNTLLEVEQTYRRRPWGPHRYGW